MKNFTSSLIATSLFVLVSVSAHSQDVTKSANVGIGTIVPTQKLDVAGNIKFSQALMPNNQPGSLGNILQSGGPNNPPTWLTNGSTGQVLVISGGVPTWTTLPLTAGWALAGNSNTTPGTNYIGTNDNTTLVFKVNNSYAGLLDATTYPYDTYLGAGGTIPAAYGGQTYNGAGNDDAGSLAGGYSVALGFSALGSQNNTNAGINVVIGAFALPAMVNGRNEVSIGAYSQRWFSPATELGYNTAVGSFSMYANLSGSYNTAVGYQSMMGGGGLTTGIAYGSNNSAFGYNALYMNGGTAGLWSNTAIGSNSLYNAAGSRNTAVGDSALYSTTGTNNTAIGYQANVVSGAITNATAIGYQASASVSNSITLGNASVTSLYLPGYTAIGDVLYTSTNTGLVGALTPGASGTILESGGVGAPPAWVSVSGVNSIIGTPPIYTNGGAAPAVISIQGNNSGTDAGGVLYSLGAGNSALFTLTPTAANQVLTSAAAGGAPTWQAPASASGAWSLTGNSGTTPTTNFIGTTDASGIHGLVFKVDNLYAGSIDAPSGSFGGEYDVYLGYGTSGSSNSGAGNTGDEGGGGAAFSNVAVGTAALGNMASTTTVRATVAVGAYAMYNISGGNGTTGATNSNINDDAIGAYSLYNNTANNNVGVGSYALYSNTAGVSETALGYYSMYGSGTAGTMGNGNTAAGFESLYSITTGGSNTAVGSSALYSNTGGKNTALGDSALASNTIGEENTAVGYQAMVNTAGSNGNTTGSFNTALGYYANVASNALTNATAIGAFAYAAQSNSLVLGSINGINNATANTNVGIGTNTPDADAALAIKTGHIETQAASTSTTAAAFAGSGVTSVTSPVIGTDVGGVVTFTVPLSGVAGGQVTVTFANAYNSPPTVIISPANSQTGGIMGAYQPYVTYTGGTTYNNFTINFTGAPSASTSLSFNYFVIETQ